MQGRDRGADVEDGHADTEEEEEGGTHWETGTDVYILPGVKQIAGGKLLSA